MRRVPWRVLLLVACLGDSRSLHNDRIEFIPRARAEAAPPAATGAAQRCLPVVAARCGCVYACGVGRAQPDGSYRIRHSFWQDHELTGRVDRWCAQGACTDAFLAEIVCSAICKPKPADATCHFEGTSCVSGSKSP